MPFYNRFMLDKSDDRMSTLRRQWQRLLATSPLHIINIASMAGLVAFPNFATYSASKAYLIAFSRALSREVKSSGVKVSVVLPGPVKTQFFENNQLTIDVESSNLIPMMDPEIVARVIFESFICGKQVIVPGVLNKLQSFGLKIIPHSILIPAIGYFSQLMIKE